jgi:tetratricopeptide (TPR) repeat protein
MDLGNSYAQQGKLDLAIKELKQALQVDCNHVGAHYNLGLNYARLNQPDMAIFELKEALRINPISL